MSSLLCNGREAERAHSTACGGCGVSRGKPQPASLNMSGRAGRWATGQAGRRL